MIKDTRELVIKQLDSTVKHVARVRKGAILLEGMDPEEVDKLINEMCEKHYKTFEPMDKAEFLIESLLEAAKNDPERAKDVIGGGAVICQRR